MPQHWLQAATLGVALLLVPSLFVFPRERLVFSVLESTVPGAERAESFSHPWTEQVRQDFIPFEEGISRTMVDAAESSLRARNIVYLRVKIVDGILYAEPAQNSNDVHPMVLMILRILCRRVLPNLDFVLSLSDGPSFPRTGPRLPALSFDQSSFAWDIAYPYFSFLWIPANKSMAEPVYRQGNVPWDQKKPLAFWRGSSTAGAHTATSWRNASRFKLVSLCRMRPDLCDAGMTSLVQIVGGEPVAKAIMSEFGPLANRSADNEFLKFKTAIIVDGNLGVASRSKVMLQGNSVVLWQETKYREFFYSLLRPYVHYIPLAKSLEDLYTQLEWIRANDGRARQIAERGQRYAMDHFHADAVDAYFHHVLATYGKLQNYSVALSEQEREMNKVRIGLNNGQTMLLHFPWCSAKLLEQNEGRDQ
ncbi:glycosyl transferase family 90-domain-containing protein [Hyaloraphidium curvatum]|nr:glycosyl transferase family 90-domain-containing protein [Hyaloraphidium curvatum]